MPEINQFVGFLAGVFLTAAVAFGLWRHSRKR